MHTRCTRIDCNLDLFVSPSIHGVPFFDSHSDALVPPPRSDVFFFHSYLDHLCISYATHGVPLVFSVTYTWSYFLPYTVYLFLFSVMDPFAGGVASLMMASTYLTSNMWMAGGGSARVATAVHIMGWIAQFYGHAAHEGRAPALLDNLFQVGFKLGHLHTVK